MRVKRGKTVKRKHKKILKSTKGYRMTKSRLIKVAKEAALHAGQYAYKGRKLRKRQFRRLWITRISSAAKEHGMNYSLLIRKMKLAKIEIDRKILAHLLISDKKAFDAIIDKIKKV